VERAVELLRFFAASDRAPARRSRRCRHCSTGAGRTASRHRRPSGWRRSVSTSVRRRSIVRAGSSWRAMPRISTARRAGRHPGCLQPRLEVRARVQRRLRGGTLLESYSAERSAVGRKVLTDAGRLTFLAVLHSGVAQSIRNHAASLVFGLAAAPPLGPEDTSRPWRVTIPRARAYGRRRGLTWLRQARGFCPLARFKGTPPKTADEIALKGGQFRCVSGPCESSPIFRPASRLSQLRPCSAA